MAFDAAGTFGGALIALTEGAVVGYDPTGTVLFTYPAPSTYVLEGGEVAPLTYAPCPGCLYITAELATDLNNPSPTGPGAIFRVLPGTPSGTAVTLFTLTPGIIEPEDLNFVMNGSLACTNHCFNYFVTSYASGTQKNTLNATNGTILEFTPAQLASFVGQILVPNETDGAIYAFPATFASPGTPTVFSSGDFQLEASSILQCAASAQGCPATFGFWKHHPFPSSMFSGGFANIGCHNYSNSDLLNILNSSNSGGNAVTILGHQLIAAIANYQNGAIQTPAATQAIGEAIALLCANSIDMTSDFVQSSTTLGQQMADLANTLDNYNSAVGLNCSEP